MDNQTKSSPRRRYNRDIVIPPQYLIAHDFCLRLHDQIVGLIKHGCDKGVFNLKMHLAEDEVREWQEPGWHPWDWLERKERSAELGELLLKSIFPPLVTDFCHFVLEALLCSEKAKLTVTFALLRKPLRENLLFLEWLLADPHEFLNVFYNQQPQDLLAGRGDRDPARVKEIIGGAIQKIPGDSFYTADWQYDIRFDPRCPYGFSGLFQKALHLITTRDAFATEPQSFNFVFSGGDAVATQWEHLYLALPFVLYHAANVCEVLMATAAGDLMPDYASVEMERTLGFVLWSDEFHGDAPAGRPFPPLEVRCAKCGDLRALGRSDALLLWDDGACPCRACGAPMTMQEILDANISDSETTQ